MVSFLTCICRWLLAVTVTHVLSRPQHVNACVDNALFSAEQSLYIALRCRKITLSSNDSNSTQKKIISGVSISTKMYNI